MATFAILPTARKQLALVRELDPEAHQAAKGVLTKLLANDGTAQRFWINEFPLSDYDHANLIELVSNLKGHPLASRLYIAFKKIGAGKVFLFCVDGPAPNSPKALFTLLRCEVQAGVDGQWLFER